MAKKQNGDPLLAIWFSVLTLCLTVIKNKASIEYT
jgi:hypothetical protein